MTEKQMRGVGELVLRLVWDQEVAGSSPVTPTLSRHRRIIINISQGDSSGS